MYTFFLLVQLILVGCSKSSNKKKFVVKSPQEMLESLGPATKYYRVAEGYDGDSSVVLLVVQGGPTDYLFKKGEPLPFITYYPYFTVVHVHQAQTLPAKTEKDSLDAQLLSGKSIISLTKARQANLKSAAILHKVAQYFKDQEKTVLVVSHSFGSWLVPHTFVHYGNNFDKVVITAGRIDMPKEAVEAFINGCAGGFDEDDTQKFIPTDCDTVPFKDSVLKSRKSVGRLSGTLGENRYSDLLKDSDLSNVMYVYGLRDVNTGSLNPSEIKFLASKNVPVVALDEGHDLGDLDTYLPSTKTLKSLSEDSKASVLHFLQKPLSSTYKLVSFPANNILNLYYGSVDDSDDDKFDIGIVFEGHTRDQISYKMNSLFGDGPYSLFETKVFKDNKSKFRIYYGQIAQSASLSTYPKVSNYLLSEYFKKIVQTFTRFTSEAHLDILLEPFFTKNGVSKGDFKTYYYMSIDDKKVYDSKQTLVDPELTHLVNIDANIERFENFFYNSNKSSTDFDLKIYVSSGLGKSYIYTQGKIIYLSSNDFIKGGIPSIGLHPDVFAVAGVREIGRFVGNLAEENREYEVTSKPQNKSDLYPATDSNSRKFRNNCFSGYPLTGAKASDVKLTKILNLADGGTSYYTAEDFTFDFNLVNINNPWTHGSKVLLHQGGDFVEELEGKRIADYDGRIFPGCDGFKSFRGTEKSIVRNPYRILPSDWAEKGWGPINSFYIENALGAYQ